MIPIENDHIANWYETHHTGRLLCTLCPRYCLIGDGQRGFCFIRYNKGGTLFTEGYGRSTGFALDPIEKKPLNHFLPGSSILSFGTAGCNLGCKFCQNWSISKAKSDNVSSIRISAEDVVELSLKYNSPSIAFTYNDPVIFSEFVIDVSKIAVQNNINPVLVTAGYVDPAARIELFKYVKAANVDLKGFTEHFYKNLTYSSLKPVLETLIYLKNETEVWLEITNLIIPGQNDNPEEIKAMCNWILENLGENVPLHFSAFHPDFKMKDVPHTPVTALYEAYRIAKSAGINYCYLGNIAGTKGKETRCNNCNELLIEREWFKITLNLLKENKCPSCNQHIPGRFN
ncbi:MAG: AmmeMemoRadiSam system radical SAM enzyme [Ignavibacteriaceae bacterium]|nr:AmmeMemoRadiSam system radical SAM enzyme [Ignavibacteriaceae bacterium]